MKKIRDFFLSKRTRERINEVKNGVEAAKEERQWVENEIAPMVQFQEAYAREIIQRNHFAESLSRTFQRRVPRERFS